MGRLSLASLACIAALGCGSSTSQSTTAGPLVEEEERAPAVRANARGSEEARATVGAAGGTFALANGARLEIPSGALSEEVGLTFALGATGRAFGDAERQRPLGPMLAVEPAIASSGDAFEISIP